MTLKMVSAWSTDATGELIGYATTGSFYNQFEIQGQFFTGFSASIDFESYSDSLVSLQSAINSAISPATVTLRYDFPSDRIILSASQATNFRFNTALQQILGFDSQYLSQTVITGSTIPYYIWNSTNEYRSNDTEIYESNQVWQERIADSGRTYSVGNDKTSNFRDWVFANEPKENVYAEFAETTAPFTYDRFLKYLRKGPYPFVVFDSYVVSTFDYSNRDGTYEMRAEATKFEPKQKFPDYFDYWDIQLKTRLLSRPNQGLENNFTQLLTTGSFAGYNINNLILWLNASAGAYLNSATVLRQIQDQSPYGTLSNDNTSCDIYFSASNSSWNNKSIYHLTASATINPASEILSGTNALTSSPSGLTYCLIGEYIDSDSVAAFRPVVTVEDSASTDVFYMGTLISQVRKLDFGLYDSSAAAVIQMSSSQIPLNQKFIAIGTWNQSDNSYNFYVNGLDYQTGVYSSAGTPVIGNTIKWYMTVNSLFGATQNPGMNVAEVIVFDKVLSNSEINIMLDYANITHGITSSALPTNN